MITGILACVSGHTGGDPWSSPTGSTPSSPDAQTTVEDLDPASLPAGPDPCRAPLLAEVTDVADGDTVFIAPIGPGAEETVRLVGFDTPEVGWDGGASECWGDEARAHTISALDGEIVWLTFDSDCIDPYDRTLAYVHLGLGEGDFYNLQMVADGWGEVMIIPPNDAFAEALNELEAEARAAGLGVWSCP